VSTIPPYQLWQTREEKAALEARNGLLLSESVEKMVEPSKAGFRMTPELLCDLQSLAIKDIYTCAGKFRTVDVRITNTPHVPPRWQDVPRYAEEMCSYVNGNFGKSALHLAAYLMWRHNWIHPFAGGNGRTSRAISYLVLNVRLGFVLPGHNTIAQQIVKCRDPYYDALKSADQSERDGRLDLSAMEELLSNMLAAQLLSVHNKAQNSATQ
jgi:Fic family protein